jgi:rare lipoprotein A
MSLARRAAQVAAAAAAAGLLAACTVPPPAPGDGAGGLRPLATQPALPPGARPRSEVPSVRYDLAVSGEDEMVPDDGIPGGEDGRAIFERGGASWYGLQFHLHKTANGERFDMTAFTAAHKTLPFNTRVCVRSLVNGREVLVRINDRGPYAAGRVIDLSRAAADAIGLPDLGIRQVALSVMDSESARCAGTVVGAADPPAPPAADPPPPATPKAAARKRR